MQFLKSQTQMNSRGKWQFTLKIYFIGVKRKEKNALPPRQNNAVKYADRMTPSQKVVQTEPPNLPFGSTKSKADRL
jgi:hypothetical protein